MKICQVVPYFPYKEHLEGRSPDKDKYYLGGIMKHVYYLSKTLLKRNEVTIITTKSPQHHNLSEVVGVDIIRVKADAFLYSSPILIRILKWLDPNKYDVIHAHTPTPPVADFAVWRNARKKCPFVLTYHNDVEKEGYFGNLISKIYNNTFGHFLLKQSDAIITTTKSYALSSPLLKKYLHKVRVIPNGVDIEAFHLCLNGDRIKRKYQLNDDSKIILFVGKLDYYKGCDFLIKAFATVVQKISSAHLIIVGKGPLEKGLKQLTEKLCMQNYITFAGFISDAELPLYYGVCDLFVLPSISSNEGFGIVQLEAMACGKPVITTTIPGVREVDANEVASIHVPPMNEKALASAILKILEDAKLAKRLGENGRKLVEENYTWGSIAKRTENLYFAAISNVRKT